MKARTDFGMLALATVALIPVTAVAQGLPSDAEVSEIIRTRVEEGRSVGIVVGLLESDGSTRVVSYGSAGPDTRPLGERTVFEIGSITKVFTGVLLADMAARGEVSLEDPIEEYLPDRVGVPSRGGEITLLSLSTQRSGLPRLPNNMQFADMTNPYADYTVEEMYDFLSGYELPRDVGAQFEYSNLGVGLLGHVLALAAGVGYEELVGERILEPLGMDMTGITLGEEMREWMAAGHDEQGNVVALWDIPTLAGAGALRSNMVDMLAFLDANVGPPRSPLEGSMLDSREARADAGPSMEIGLNWLVRPVGDQRIVWHNGGTGGFRTFIGFDPDAEVGVVLLTNSAQGSDDLGFHLLNRDLPLAPAPTPVAERTEIELRAETLERYVGVYQLLPTFSITVTREGTSLFAQATGQPRARIFPEAETEFFYRIVDARITFDVDEDGVVTGMVLHQGGQNLAGQKVE